jgi:hypothetical protein
MSVYQRCDMRHETNVPWVIRTSVWQDHESDNKENQLVVALRGLRGMISRPGTFITSHRIKVEGDLRSSGWCGLSRPEAEGSLE